MAMTDGSGDFATKTVDFDDTIDDDEDSNPWEDLLNEVKQSSSKLQEHKNLIVLGDLSSGKTTLIAKLQGNEEPEKGSGLEFTHLTISDEYREDSTKLGVWVMDGDATHTGLLKYALTPDNFQDSMIVIAASLSQPWSLLKSITNWLNIITDHIDRIGLSQDVMQQCKQKLIKQYQEYVEPDSTSSIRLTAPSGGEESEEAILPLGENALIHNLGIPVMIVLTKSDAISTLEKEMEYKEERFDFIQQHIRKLCLNSHKQGNSLSVILHFGLPLPWLLLGFVPQDLTAGQGLGISTLEEKLCFLGLARNILDGASLLYVSVREEKNCDLLYKYIAHRMYGLEFSNPPSVVDRDAVFVPSGWDSEKKIAILAENLMTIKPDEEYETVIKRPPTIRRAANRDGEVAAEEHQDFLTRCHTLLSKGAPAAPAAARMEATGTKAPSKPRVGTSSGTSTPSPKKAADASKGVSSQQGETVLANFFNSLLTKKTGSPAKPSPDSNAARAELDRMTRNSKSPSS